MISFCLQGNTNATIKTQIKTSTTKNGKDEQKKTTTTTTKKSSAVDKKIDKKIRKPETATASTRSDLNKAKVNDVKKVPEKPPSKRNVMNSIHNVTVASPPSSAGRERRSVSMVDVKMKPIESNHQRSRTRTIRPEESILNKIEQPIPLVIVVPVVKEPVAFEINFEEAKKPKVPEKLEISKKNEEDFEYESDFESYESDFEDEVPSESEHEDDLENKGVSNDDEKNSDEVDDSGNETQEMTKKTSASSHLDASIDATTINSHDSVLSYDPTVYSRNQEIFKRGKEIMKKVVFDTMNFDIYEMKPLPYDAFIAIYGDRDMLQVSTQIDSLQVSDDTQTDELEYEEKWVQYPARFTREGVEVPKSKLFNEEKLGVGEGSVERKSIKDNETDKFACVVENINNFSKLVEPLIETTKHFDSRGYRNFLDTSELFISRALEKVDRVKSFRPSDLEFCDGFIQLKHDDLEQLKDTKVVKIYSNKKINSFFFTIHRCSENLLNLVCLWDSIHSSRPLKIFQSWSQLSCIETHENQKEFIVGGCDDGTMCIWDAAEFIEWSDDESLSIKPCQIVSPNSDDKTSEQIVAIKSLNYPKFKALSAPSKITQFCSLNRIGIIVIWTLTPIEYKEDDLSSKKFQSNFLDFLHVKSRARLVKNITVDLNVQLRQVFEKTQRKKSAFEKTRYYFENDLFSDKVLKELQEINTVQGNKTNEYIPDFTGFETSFNEIFAASQLNYFIALSRLNFTDTRKVFTTELNSNSISAMKIHPKRSNVMAVGHMNGEVRFMKIFEDENSIQLLSKNKKKLQRTKNFEADDLTTQQSSPSSSDNAKKDMKINFDKNILNTFELWQGAVSVIEFDKQGSLMFVIIGNQLRVYDCRKNCEIECKKKLSLVDLKCVEGADCCEYLVSFYGIRKFLKVK